MISPLNQVQCNGLFCHNIPHSLLVLEAFRSGLQNRGHVKPDQPRECASVAKHLRPSGTAGPIPVVSANHQGGKFQTSGTKKSEGRVCECPEKAFKLERPLGGIANSLNHGFSGCEKLADRMWLRAGMEAHVGPYWKTSTHPLEARYEITKPITTPYDHCTSTKWNGRPTGGRQERTRTVISTLGIERSHFVLSDTYTTPSQSVEGESGCGNARS